MSVQQQLPADSQLPVPLLNKLRGLSREDLEEVLDNREKVDGLVMDSEEVQNLQLEREMSLATNRSLAETNLQLQPRLESGKTRLLERYAELRAVHQAVMEQHRRLESHGKQADPDSLLATLQAEGATVEVDSEELAESFLGGQCALDVFLERYAELRRLAHARRVRVEKLQEILVQRARTAPPSPPPGVPAPALPRRPPPPRPPQPAPRPPSHLPYDPNPDEAGRTQDPSSAPYPLAQPTGTPSYSGGTPSFPWGAPSFPVDAPSYPAPNPRGAPSYPDPNPQGAPPYPQGAISYPAPNLQGAPSYPQGAPSYPAPNPQGDPSLPRGAPSYPAPSPWGDPSYPRAAPSHPAPDPQEAPPYPAPLPPPSPHFYPRAQGPPYPIQVPYTYPASRAPPRSAYPQPRPY